MAYFLYDIYVRVTKSAMTSTERSRKRRAQIYWIKVNHKELLAKNDDRKRTAYLEKDKMRSESTEMQEEFKGK